jgi:hypothetical protein
LVQHCWRRLPSLRHAACASTKQGGARIPWMAQGCLVLVLLVLLVLLVTLLVLVVVLLLIYVA